MPNLFVIGAMKCGTTSLHHYLGTHPEISMSTLKEPRYFLRHLEDYPLPLVSDRKEYLGLFENGARYRGEASPGYSKKFEWPGVPESISKEVEDPRFIYLVNDPVERVPSIVQQHLASRDAALRGLYEAIDGQIGQSTLTEVVGDVGRPGNVWLESGLYMSQLVAYFECFPPESIMVVDSNDLKSRRRETMTRIFRFLGLEPFFEPVEMGRELNVGEVQVRDSDLYLAVIGNPAAERIKAILPQRLRAPWVERVRRTVGTRVPKPQLEDGLRLELEDLYRPEVQQLRVLTGQDFSTWSI